MRGLAFLYYRVLAYSRQELPLILLAVYRFSMQPNTEAGSDTGTRAAGARATGMIGLATCSTMPSWAGSGPAWLGSCKRPKSPPSALAPRVQTVLTVGPRSVSPHVPLDTHQDASRRRVVPTTPRWRSSVPAGDGYADACAAGFESVARLVIAVALGSALSGCTGGGGSGGSPSPPEPACAGIETAHQGCLSLDEFAEQRDKIATEYLTDFEFRNQSALEFIGTHEAYVKRHDVGNPIADFLTCVHPVEKARLQLVLCRPSTRRGIGIQIARASMGAVPGSGFQHGLAVRRGRWCAR